MIETFESVRNDNRLLIEYVRGSSLYGLNTPTSDIDTGGVYMTDKVNIITGLNIPTQISDEKHDNIWYEITEFSRLLIKSNPTILESLFVPEDKLITKPHPLFMPFIEERDNFVTKACFKPFFYYAKSQIEKAKGLNKKINQEARGENMTRKSCFDFIYTYYNQGSTKLVDWLRNHGLKQEYCGLVKIPNMTDMYGLYYDWPRHLIDEEFIKDGINVGDMHSSFYLTMEKYFRNNVPELGSDGLGFCFNSIINYLSDEKGNLKPYNYRGIIEDFNTATSLRLSPIVNPKDKPLIYISYNKNAFEQHCRMYHEMVMWRKERNEARYLSNLNKSYDSKNMMHSFRMIHMAKEIANGEGIKIVRTEDKEFLMDIRNHKYEYDYLIEKLEEETNEMNDLILKSTIKESVDVNLVQNLLYDLKRKFIV